MSTDPATPVRPAAPRVVAVVIADDAGLVEPCLEAIARQVYEPSRVFVVGGDDEVRRVTGDAEALWRPNLRALYDAIGEGVEFVWALRQRSRPEPEALAMLVADATRVDASVAGSKVVEAADSERLVSVGYATDVFAAPFSGLQAGELDQAQFDVIRDVAAVSDASMLIRRDLFRGLGGIDRSMPPTSAAIDFCQRARLRGGRVVVVPASVVGYEGPDPEPRWRERAGEVRAMIKAYSPLTLAWALPVAFLVGLAETVLGLFIGRFHLPGLLAAGVWNLVNLPSALRGRFQARRGRDAGDEELFRYQVNGSARLRQLWDDVMDRYRRRFPEGVLSGFSDAVEAGQQRIRNPAFFVGFLMIVAALVATRHVWGDGLPTIGFSLPPPDSALDALGAYAGGWNPAGLGSPEVLRPDVAATALVQLVVLGRAGAAVAVIVVGSFLGGVFGTARFLRRFGIGSTPGYLAGLVLMAGPGLAAAAATTQWVVIPAVASFPWALSAAAGPTSGSRRLPRLAATTLAVGIGAAFAPATLPVALVAAGVWALVGVGNRVRSLGSVALATVLAVPLLMPWVLYADLGALFTDGAAAYWSPSPWLMGIAGAAVVGVLLTRDANLGALASWGAILAGIGAVGARTADLGGGVEAEMASAAAVALGTALLAGAGLEAATRLRDWGGVGAFGARLGAFGAIALVLSSFAVVGPGRAGLPQGDLGDTYAFTESSGPESRMLVFGPADSLPGTSRDLAGLRYRVFVPPDPHRWDAYLNEPRLGDEALHALLIDLVDGRVRRAGEALAAFGIEWVVFTEPNPLQTLFEAQLDLLPLRSLDFPVFRNEVPTATALAANGVGWPPKGTGFARPAGTSGDVVVASNADFRWGPGSWEQVGWATSVTPAGDTIGFSGYAPRRYLALGSLVWLLLLFGVVWGERVRVSRKASDR